MSADGGSVAPQRSDTRNLQRRDLQIIAEMIDDPKGLQFIRECGVDYAQGFLFGEPAGDVKNFDTRQLFTGGGWGYSAGRH